MDAFNISFTHVELLAYYGWGGTWHYVLCEKSTSFHLTWLHNCDLSKCITFIITDLTIVVYRLLWWFTLKKLGGKIYSRKWWVIQDNTIKANVKAHLSPQLCDSLIGRCRLVDVCASLQHLNSYTQHAYRINIKWKDDRWIVFNFVNQCILFTIFILLPQWLLCSHISFLPN